MGGKVFLSLVSGVGLTGAGISRFATGAGPWWQVALLLLGGTFWLAAAYSFWRSLRAQAS
jgi:hypothetical protein